ncbi:hypothetical protein [Desulfobacter postgatei]|uniref:hypothetical protein n=1 Tax=Desulfobacter postgatei TaxID=2293 RepID=UPI00259B00F7|nr:hypothetical protein [uncultured Desulfobacter sp.]
MPLILLAATIPQAQVQAPGGAPAWTPESVLITFGFGVIAVLIALVGWLSKKQLNTILDTIKAFTEKQSACREELSNRFADKESTARDIKELYARTDKHESCLQRHSVLIGGRRAGDKE